MSILKCGAAERCVTPPLNKNIPQCMSLNLSTGIKDELYTHAIAVEADGHCAILISIDTSGLGTSFTNRVRRALEAEIGVEPSAVMVSAIHIHTGGPQLMDVFWGQGEDKEVEELFLRQTVAAAVEAYNNRVEVIARYGEGKEDRISFCRNYRMADGSIKMNPGRKNASDIVGPVSEIDYTVSTLRFDDTSGKPIAEIVNFACHPDTVGGHEYCADYPGELRRQLKAVYGEDHTVLFINGCSGNVNHVDAKKFVDPDFRYPKDHYKSMGKMLADDVLAIHNSESFAKVCDSTKVSFAHRRFRAARRQPDEERIGWATEMLTNETASGVSKSFAKEIMRLHKHPKRFELVEMQAIRIGDVSIVGFPGEPFADIGLRLRKKVAPTNIMISELANNELGYFATEPAFSAGVYEAVLPSDPFELDVIDKMIDTAAELVNKL